MNRTLWIVVGFLPLVAAALIWNGQSEVNPHKHMAASDDNLVSAASIEDKSTHADSMHVSAPAPGKLPVSSVFPELRSSPLEWMRLKPPTLTVSPVEGAPLSFKMVRFVEEQGQTTWTGRNPEIPLAALVITAGAGVWAGGMLLPDGTEYRMHGLSGDLAVVRKVGAAPLSCGSAPAAEKIKTNKTRNAVEISDVVVPSAEPELDTLDAEGFYHATVLIVVDKAFFDNMGLPDTATEERRKEEANSVCRYYIGMMNVILDNSLVTNLRWKLAGTLIAPGDFINESLSDSLDQVKRNRGIMGIPARKEASALGADHILYIAGAFNAADPAGGVASQTGNEGTFSPYAAVYDIMGIDAWAHELGHNIGLYHDRITESRTIGHLPGKEPADGDGKYHYGHMWELYCAANAVNMTCGDVMSYAKLRVPYFSNPDIELPNTEVALSGYGHDFPPGYSVLGVPADQPRAADAARYLREKAQLIASFRRPIEFLNHPASVSAAPRSTITLWGLASVGRTDFGNYDEITYQWYFSSTVAITSATTRVLTIRNISAADAGDYTLKATSMGGVTIASEPARVTVSPSAPMIISQPQAAIVIKGGAFMLSAVASGDNLRFQWQRNNSAIAGANSASYGKSNAQESDAGSYTLTVSNESGSVTSHAAVVTVQNGPAGGGGGGSPSVYYFGLLAVLIAAANLKIDWRAD